MSLISIENWFVINIKAHLKQKLLKKDAENHKFLFHFKKWNVQKR